MGKRIIYLIRNAQYDRENNLQMPLTPIGIQQAQYTGQALSNLHIDAIYYSPYTQMYQTTQVVNRQLRVDIHDNAQLKQYEDEQQQDIATFTREMLMAGNDRQQQQITAIYDSFFHNTQADDLRLVLIAHGNIIRDLICYAIGVNPATWQHMLIHNCGISSVAISVDGSVEMLAYNETKHLPQNLLTE